MKTFQYTFWNKVCPTCNQDAVQDFWMESEDILCNGCHCITCQKQFDFRMTSEKTTPAMWTDRVRYILHSSEVSVVRVMNDNELIKKHGVEAHWFRIGRTLYIDPVHPISKDSDILEFENTYFRVGMTLVYMLNNYLQRLYFFVPSNAIA